MLELIRQGVVWVTGGFLGALFGIVVVGMLTRRINTAGLLFVRVKGKRQLSPQRVQLLLMTLAGAGQYLGSVLANYKSGALPPAPKELVALLGVSHLSYLGSKSYYSLLKRN